MSTRSNHPFAPPGWAWFLLIGLILWKVWIGPFDPVGVASAQIPDSAAQRKQLIEELRRTNELLARIDETIRTHTIKVRVTGADNTPAVKKPGKGR